MTLEDLSDSKDDGGSMSEDSAEGEDKQRTIESRASSVEQHFTFSNPSALRPTATNTFSRQ